MLGHMYDPCLESRTCSFTSRQWRSERSKCPKENISSKDRYMRRAVHAEMAMRVLPWLIDSFFILSLRVQAAIVAHQRETPTLDAVRRRNKAHEISKVPRYQLHVARRWLLTSRVQSRR